MTTVPFAYRLAVGAARAAAPLLARSTSKLGRGMAGRRRAHKVLVDWAEKGRRGDRPLVWIHAPSVGEGLQARAVTEALRGLRPDLQVAFTYFSPSAEPFGRRFGADVAGYLPWDQRSLVGPVLDALRPDVLVFTKTEVWPVLVEEARNRGIPVALVAATVPPGAGRLSRPARALLRTTWARISAGLACSEEDAARLVELGVPPRVVAVTGDPAIDSAAERARAADPLAPYLSPFHADPRPTLVAGSTWPSDEAVLLPALRSAREEVPRLRVIVAPHEPSGDRVGGLIGAFMEEGWRPSTLAHVEEEGGVGETDVVVVERVGVLAHLYTVGSVAYVGGGFHGAGLHSVLEPAAAGIPVLFGPGHQNAQAAADLIDVGGGRVVRDATELARALVGWLTAASGKEYAGTRAAEYIERHLGAAARTAASLEALIPPSAAP